MKSTSFNLWWPDIQLYKKTDIVILSVTFKTFHYLTFTQYKCFIIAFNVYILERKTLYFVISQLLLF